MQSSSGMVDTVRVLIFITIRKQLCLFALSSLKLLMMVERMPLNVRFNNHTRGGAATTNLCNMHIPFH